MVYNIAIVDSGEIQRGTQFPLCSKKRDYKKKKDTALIGLSETNFNRIERHQPYREGGILKKLEELSNADKHRHLILLAENSVGAFTIAKTESGFETDFNIDVALCFEDESEVIETLKEIHGYIDLILTEFQSI